MCLILRGAAELCRHGVVVCGSCKARRRKASSWREGTLDCIVATVINQNGLMSSSFYKKLEKLGRKKESRCLANVLESGVSPQMLTARYSQWTETYIDSICIHKHR